MNKKILSFTPFVILMVVVTLALGVWQLERRIWKLELIEHYEAAKNLPPKTIQSISDIDTIPEIYRDGARVVFNAVVDTSKELHAFAVYRGNVGTAGKTVQTSADVGYWIFSPATLADGSLIIVNRGTVPMDQKNTVATRQVPQQAIRYEGVVRISETGNFMTPAPDLVKNIWYARNSVEMTKLWDLKTNGTYYVQLTQSAPNTWPQAQQLNVVLPNNHLGYAFTWFGLAFVIAVGYMVWLKKERSN